MTESLNLTLCHRCGNALSHEPEGSLMFCAHCGAAQVWLSEELREKAGALTPSSETDTDSQAAQQNAADPTAVVWRGAVRCAALAAAIAAGLTLLSMAVPPVLLLTWLWIIASPVVVLGIYHSRYPQTRLSAGLGARIGLLTGLFVMLVIGTMNTSALVITRRMHALGEFDARLTQVMQQSTSQADAMAGNGAPNPFPQMMAVPEFRVGMMLSGVAMATVLLLGLTAMGGTFAGMMRAKAASSPQR